MGPNYRDWEMIFSHKHAKILLLIFRILAEREPWLTHVDTSIKYPQSCLICSEDTEVSLFVTPCSEVVKKISSIQIFSFPSSSIASSC